MAHGGGAGDARASASSARFDGLYPLERGADGDFGQWMRNRGVLAVRGSGVLWVAVNATSWRAPRTLSVRRQGRVLSAMRVPTHPVTLFLGPLAVRGATRLALEPVGGAQPAPAGDSRRLSIFLGSPVVSRQPVAAFPRKGFWPTETASDGTRIRWLRQSGVLEVVSAPSISRAWLLFDAASDRRRTLRVADAAGRAIGPALALAAGLQPRHFAVGPFPLTRGRAPLSLQARPGPRSPGGKDRRPLSVLFSHVQVSATPPAGSRAR